MEPTVIETLTITNKITETTVTQLLTNITDFICTSTFSPKSVSDMGEIVLSSFFSVLFDKLAATASSSFQKLVPYTDIDSEIEKLQQSLSEIHDLLTDASQKEITDNSVKRWLNSLQHLAYDIDDVLDDLATEQLGRQWSDESETHTNKVRKFIPNPFSKHSSRTREIKDKINDITTKIEDLMKEKTTLGLIVKEQTRSKDINRSLQTSIVDASWIVGREAEKDALVHNLLGDEPCDRNFSIVPIVGMGGVGKTTLARLLYDDKQVKEHFELKAWVCVSDEFDSFAISKDIFQAVAGIQKEFASFNLLQVDLEKHLRDKKFLLVLDDVWSERCQDWDTLVGPFRACAPGSKIIMTTRKDKLLQMLGYTNLNQLRSLPHEDSLSLLALYALGVNNFDSHLSLKPYGEGIVKRCNGLPLALKALGRLLYNQNGEYWKKVLHSEIWELRDERAIIPALRLSYHDLPALLKRLFAYSSLFPKDYMFDKEVLVQLWMAEGFLHDSTPSNTTEERMGHEYFDDLLSRSFFQHAPDDRSLFVMHDMMNDLATFVASEFFLRSEKDNRSETLEKYRHMSFIVETYIAGDKFEPIKRAKSLRTFLATSVGDVRGSQHVYLPNKILVDLLSKLPLLRVLSLSGFKVSELPESIVMLKHLRYLNLSRTLMEHLPENVCNLYNLQTLILFGCSNLSELPNNLFKLKNLTYLDIRVTPRLKKLPSRVSELKSLQTLAKFIIDVEDGTEITRLGDLKNLRGEISIVGLEKVQNARHAREACILEKRFSGLEFVWSDMSDGSRNELREKEVLKELKPSNEDLKQLKIMSYGGLEFPDWVGDPSFSHLKHVSISGCRKCTSLPPLGQLMSLKELFIQGLDELKVVGLELPRKDSSFPSLEILSLIHMRGWEKWLTNSGVESFPRLYKLVIRNCPNLVQVSVEALPSLKVLEIYKCGSVVLSSLIQVASVITKLDISDISGLDDVVWRNVINRLGVVEDLKIRYCDEIRYLWESEVVASNVLMKLRKLDLYHCDKLLSLGEKEDGDNRRSNLLTSLKALKVNGCKNMERCICPDSIETLSIQFSDSITFVSLPSGGQNLKSLYIWGCKKLLEMEWEGQKMLESVMIRNWLNLKSIIQLDHLVHLTELIIIGCESLESFPVTELPNLTTLKHLEITGCPRMDACFPSGVWPPNLCSLELGNLKKPISQWGQQHFPSSLEKLSLRGGDDGVTSCSQFSHLFPSSLTSLRIYNFKKLETFSTTGLPYLQRLWFDTCPNLSKLSHPPYLTSLQHLYCYSCPNMVDLPQVLLPFLLTLTIRSSPKLKERCSEGGSYWHLVSLIPSFRTVN